MDVRDVVRDLTLEGSAHFHASYVADKAHISTREAHEQLAALQKEGVLDVNFDVICPESDRTVGTFRLGDNVPFGETYIEPTGDCEPFELTEDDILVTYTPKTEYLRQLLREGSKKKTLARPRRHGLRKIVSRMLPVSSPSRRPAKSSTSRKGRALPGR
jgi:hypothetical protein